MKEKCKNCGVIYILTNPSFKEYVKIGYAKDLTQRLKQLNVSAAIPYAFRVYATYAVPKPLADKDLHRLIDQLNPDLRTIDEFNGKKRVKEFYVMSAETAYSLLESIAKISGTEDCLQKCNPDGSEIKDEKAAESVKSDYHRKPMDFIQCGINVGSEIVYIKNPSITATVVDGRHVKYKGEVRSVSSLAKELLNVKHAINGMRFFRYNGELLIDIYSKVKK